MHDVESKAIQNKYSDEEDEAFCTRVNCFAAITIPSFFGKYAQNEKSHNLNFTYKWNLLYYIFNKTIYLFQSYFHSSWLSCAAPVQITRTVYILWQQKDHLTRLVKIRLRPYFVSIIYHLIYVITFAQK